MKILISLFALASLLCGCATTESYLPEKPISKEFGKITVIREYAEPTAFAVLVFLNEEKAAAISNKSYVSFSVPKGEHILRFAWPKTASSGEFKAKIQVSEYSEHFFYVAQNIEIDNVDYIRTAVSGIMNADISEDLRVAEITPTQAAEIIKRMNTK